MSNRGSSTNVGGIPFQCTSLAEAIHLVAAEARALRETGLHLHFANAYSISLTDSNSQLAEIYKGEQALCFPDGKPVVWAAKFLNRNRAVMQVRGPSFFREFLGHPSTKDIRHYFLGGTPETLRMLVEFLGRIDGVDIAGYESPPFRELTPSELSDIVTRIRESGANIVWIGLGTPKQDYEARRIARLLPVITIAIGAAFDYISGSMQEAPKWIRSIGFEWLYRLVREPKRLWRRYLIGNLVFLRLALTRHEPVSHRLGKGRSAEDTR